MKFRRTTAALGLVLSGALVLGACTSGDAEEATESSSAATTATSGTGEATATSGCLQDAGITETAAGEVKYTVGPNEWSGYNSMTAANYSTYNSVIAAKMFSGFTYFGTDGSICDDTSFGSYEVTSEDPLTIKYTISDDAVWSDGTPVTINDYLLDWAAQNPEFIAPGYASGEDPDAAAVFNHVSNTAAADILDGPQGEVGSKTFTVTYDAPNPDYKIIITSALPAHVVAKNSGLEPDELAQAILDRDADTVKKAADFWNEGWNFNPGELPDASEMPSSGPYKVKDGGWVAGNSLTLEANDQYWGAPAATENLIFRFIDQAGMVQALQNGDVNVIEPQATVDTLGQLQAIGDSVTVAEYSTLTWEHLDFNFRDSNVFSDAQGGIELRQALAYCIPRQTIVDTLIKPISSDSVVMNAREVFPFQDNYDAVVAAAYGGEYDQVDIAKSKELVEASGIETPIDVRVGYASGNQRRADEVSAIAASCKDAGFNVIDSNSADFFSKELVNGDYELALFAWAGSGQITSGQNIYASNMPQNYGQYSNETVDAAWETLASSLDPAVQLEQVKVIEKELWDTLFGIPVFAHPGIAGYDSGIKNVRPTSTQDAISWNASQWQLS
ncbi:ABC transporter family substrate-binding protein [Tessaracoccus palaemonis]|uniref:ABC transporter family substrate-binding protein n=1 Tax=Tessaracoccus palaemonis TaxID=2829499 RepID=A0ABX8SJX1_9ACTN|nr:ABC transporter family substrate-binding protein [Tessaracoccus palaemonis]QXT63590.1 ABC transporter family substrate-binding protein [Tessaracoccus palaemonis]